MTPGEFSCSLARLRGREALFWRAENAPALPRRLRETTARDVVCRSRYEELRALLHRPVRTAARHTALPTGTTYPRRVTPLDRDDRPSRSSVFDATAQDRSMSRRCRFPVARPAAWAYTNVIVYMCGGRGAVTFPLTMGRGCGLGEAFQSFRAPSWNGVACSESKVSAESGW